MNKKIPTVLAFAIIVVLAVIIGGGILGYQYWWMPKEEVPEIETPPDETAGWKVFTDNEVGYSLKYPPELKAKQASRNGLKGNITRVILPIASAAGLPPNRWEFKSDYLVLSIERQKIDDITDEYPPSPPGYTKEVVLQDEKDLKSGEFGYSPPFSLKESQRVVKIDDKIYGKEFITLGMFDVCDVLPTRTLIFFKNGYKVSVVLQAWAVDKLMSELPQYFTIDKENCGNSLTWNFSTESQSQFYNDLANGKIDPETEAGIWYNTFDKIVSAINLFDTTSIQDETADWKTYRSKKYQFEFKYPQIFSLDDSFEWSFFNSTFGKESYRFKFRDKEYSDINTVSITMAPKENDVLWGTRDKKTGDSSSSNVYKDYTGKEILYTLTKTYERGQLNVNNITWDIVKIHYDGGPKYQGKTFSILFYLTKNDFTYILECNDYNYPDYKSAFSNLSSQSIEPLCYQIASSFIFLNKDGVSRWSKYKNEKYGFEFEYPINAMEVLEKPIIENSYCNIADEKDSCELFTSGISVNVISRSLDEKSIHKYDELPLIGEVVEVTEKILIGDRLGYGYDLVSAVNYKIHGFMVPLDNSHFLEVSENSKWPSLGQEDWNHIISTFKFIEK